MRPESDRNRELLRQLLKTLAARGLISPLNAADLRNVEDATKRAMQELDEIDEQPETVEAPEPEQSDGPLDAWECGRCGAEVGSGQQFCVKCGEPIEWKSGNRAQDGETPEAPPKPEPSIEKEAPPASTSVPGLRGWIPVPEEDTTGSMKEPPALAPATQGPPPSPPSTIYVAQTKCPSCATTIEYSRTGEPPYPVECPKCHTRGRIRK